MECPLEVGEVAMGWVAKLELHKKEVVVLAVKHRVGVEHHSAEEEEGALKEFQNWEREVRGEMKYHSKEAKFEGEVDLAPEIQKVLMK